MTSTDPEIQPANPRLRRIRTFALPALVLGALGSLFWLHRRMLDLELVALSSPDAAADGLLILAGRFFASLGILLGLIGSWYAVVAWKTLRAERYPPADLPVASDTTVRRGGAARLRGLVGLFLAILLLLVALLLPVFGPRVVYDQLLPAFEVVE